MNQQLQSIHDKQKASWDKFSSGWKKWDMLTMKFIRPHGDAIIEALKIKPSDNVLDVAGGTGEPGLTIAGMLNDGQIIISDLSDRMLEVAKGKASLLNINNVVFRQADACELPFEDNTFDKVSCRLGLMFVPDIELGLKEIYRVLKPGGTFATTVWAGPEKNFWVTCMAESISRYVDLPSPPPDSPGIFRCAEPGMMVRLFEKVGYKGIEESFIKSKMEFDYSEQYWEMMTDVAAPFEEALKAADEATFENIHQNAVRMLQEKHPDNKIDATGILIYGYK